MDGREVKETTLSKLPVISRKPISLYAFRGEVLVDEREFTPEMRELATIRPKCKDPEADNSFPLFETHDTTDPERPAMVGIPRAFAAQCFPNARIEDRRPALPVGVNGAMFELNLTPRASQVPAIDCLVHTLQTHRSKGAILTLPCGTGKTFAAFAVAQKLSRELGRTVPLVAFVYNETQMDQWQERAHMYCGSTARVGILQKRQRPKPDDNVIIAMMDTVCMLGDAKALEHARGGLAVFDEAHHLSSPTRARGLADSVPCEFRLAITATLDRPDKSTHAISYLVGPHVYDADRLNWELDVRIVPVVDPTFQWKKKYDGSIDYTTSVTRRFASKKFMEQAERVMRQLVEKEHYHLLVTARRRKPLAELNAALGPELSGQLVGGATSKAKKKRSREAMDKPVCLSSETITREALDGKFTAAMFMSSIKFTPHLEQAAGRVTRSEVHAKGERLPLVVDYYMATGLWNRHFQTRLAFYRKHDFNIFKCDGDGRVLGEYTDDLTTTQKLAKPQRKRRRSESGKGGVVGVDGEGGEDKKARVAMEDWLNQVETH